MGIDIEIYIRTEPTLEALTKVRALSKERNDNSSCKYPVIDYAVALHPRDGRERSCINISSASRYFSEHYPRGYWPEIRRSLVVLRETFPGIAIEYGSDCSDYAEGRPVTDEFLAEMDELWKAKGCDDEQ